MDSSHTLALAHGNKDIVCQPSHQNIMVALYCVCKQHCSSTTQSSEDGCVLKVTIFAPVMCLYSPARAGVTSLLTQSLPNRQRQHGLERFNPSPWQPDRHSCKIDVNSMDSDSGCSNMGSSWVLRSCRVYSSVNYNAHCTFTTEWTPHACANRKALILKGETLVYTHHTRRWRLCSFSNSLGFEILW